MVKALPLLFSVAAAQQAGKVNDNDLMPFPFGECTSDGCVSKEVKLSLDSNWRWTHKTGTTDNCYTQDEWKDLEGTQVCEDGDTDTCANECAVGGWPKDQWEKPYGVNKTKNGMTLGYVTKGPYSVNVGTRLFVMEDDKYKQFKLIGNEVSVVVDMSKTECGLNGAIYFVEMDPDGDKGEGANNAGAAYGTGYCDAQCPRDLKWIKGKANTKPHWVPDKKDPNKNIGTGGTGICCAELDLWEANKISYQMALHPADKTGQETCYLEKECGSQESGQRNDGPTDRNGCYINPYFFGHEKFYGPGDDFTINTKQAFAIVTEFRDDGNGDLEGMYQYYYQNGKKIPQPEYKYGSGNAMTNDFCKKMFEDKKDDPFFLDHGGMPQFSKSVKNGMTMVMSFWDDMATDMNWLDSGERGTCDPTAGDPRLLRETHPDASFGIRHVRWGPIGTTHNSIAEELARETPVVV